MSMKTTRAWHLKSRPSGTPTLDNFELKPLELPALAAGMVRVENRWLSVDPYMRGRMNDAKSYIPAFEVSAPMEGGAVGQVVESRSPDHAVGDKVTHFQGWREMAVGAAAEFAKVPALPNISRCIAPDMRGYGGSSVPDEPSAYALREIVGDEATRLTTR